MEEILKNDNQEEVKTKEKPEDVQDKKIKNLISAVILLAGLFVGSLFVDSIQLVRGQGLSQKALKSTDIFSLDGKTWVAYTDPIVKLKVISDENCEACNPSEALVWLRRVLPTILPEKIDANSEEGKNILSQYGIKTIPAFIFSQDVNKTDFYSLASSIFIQKEKVYTLQTNEIGIPIGKYVELPSIGESDIQFGNKDSKVKIIEFSDFQCPYCRAFQLNTISKVLKDYKDKVFLVYKNFPLAFHKQAENAALAALCANEQGKFEDYSIKLFNLQDDWGKSEGTLKFKTYAAQLGLKTSDFNQCLDDKKYQDKLNQDKEEGKNFSISGTPAVFINDQFKGGAVSYEEIKKIIDEQLAEEENSQNEQNSATE